MDEHAEVVELQAAVEQVDRVAAIDIAKASAMVCTRMPGESNPARRVQKTWPVKATTNAIAELGDHLVCQSVTLVVMEATGDYWRPFVRHEALVSRAGVKGPCRRSVAAGR
ncbi:hypothetical protein [Catenulispora pinisilvae]|uniref:hypothetical protein n=1 Tax=Catenulispora pinisilvae TaxID=2705253 RepID=UPI0018918848|nr:hypothetical protein [Catenulispora pinisilvae]